MDTKDAGTKGGQARTEAKRLATRENLKKAREAKQLYRMDPSKRPARTDPVLEVEDNGL